MCRKILRAWSHVPSGETVTWDRIKAQVLRSKPPNQSTIPFIFQFLVRYGGGASGDYICDTDAFVRACGYPNRTLIGVDIFLLGDFSFYRSSEHQKLGLFSSYWVIIPHLKKASYVEYNELHGASSVRSGWAKRSGIAWGWMERRGTRQGFSGVMLVWSSCLQVMLS